MAIASRFSGGWQMRNISGKILFQNLIYCCQFVSTNLD